MQDNGTFGLLVECPFDRFHLPADASYAIQ
jgi:hypothetical protein